MEEKHEPNQQLRGQSAEPGRDAAHPGVSGVKHRSASQALRESEEKYRAVFENAATATVIIEEDKTISLANDRFVQLAGFPRKEIEGKKRWTEFVVPKDLERMSKQHDARRKTPGKALATYEFGFVARDGSVRDIILSVGMISGTMKSVASLLDITERKRANEALRQSDKALSQIVAGVSVPIFVINSQHVLTHWNKACEALTGIPADQVTGTQEHWKAFYSEKRPVMADLIVDHASDEEIARWYGSSGHESPLAVGAYEGDGLFTTLGKGGRWLYFTAAPLRDIEGKVIGAIETIQDVTEDRQRQQTLREYSERLEEMVEERTKQLCEAQEELLRKEKLATLGQVAATMSHELRNPLGAIGSGAYFLKMALPDPDPEVSDTLDILELETRNCSRIVQDLLDFTRIRPLVHLVKTNVNRVVRETLSRATVPSSVAVVDGLDKALPPILADPIHLRQVFGNIITNAFQAMPEGGRLVVESHLENDDLVAISFTDTGMGIPKENQGRLFEPLFTTKAKGIGLGLALCKTLVESHGGTIEAQSELGKGSTFTIRLPIGGTPGLQA